MATNSERAARAIRAVSDYFDGQPIEDIEDAAVDLITDLLHAINLAGGSPAEAHERAYYEHYLAEVEEDHQ